MQGGRWTRGRGYHAMQMLPKIKNTLENISSISPLSTTFYPLAVNPPQIRTVKGETTFIKWLFVQDACHVCLGCAEVRGTMQRLVREADLPQQQSVSLLVIVFKCHHSWGYITEIDYDFKF